MRMPSSLRLVIATWIAALVGALAGRSLAEASGTAPQNDTIAQSARASMGPGARHATLAARLEAP
jgi:hypothetical protein